MKASGKVALPTPIGTVSKELQIEASPEDLSAIQRLFGKMTPGFLRDGIGIIDDNVRFARFKNFCRIVAEANQIMEKYGLKPGNIPLKIGQKFIEDASLEDEPTIQKMWSNLLASVSSGRADQSVIFVSILKDLSKVEAEILMFFTLKPRIVVLK